MEIILASTSPRRIELMEWLGVPFTAVPSLFDEKSVRDENPAILTQKLSKLKARSVSNKYASAIIIGSDSVGEFKGQILEKVENIEEQRRLIKSYKGQEVMVYTSVYLINTESGQEELDTKIIKCRMADYPDSLIEEYIKSGKGLGKAGGLGVQDCNGAFVESIEGCYTGALGYQICEVSNILKKMGIGIEVDIKNIVREKTGKEC